MTGCEAQERCLLLLIALRRHAINSGLRMRLATVRMSYDAFRLAQNVSRNMGTRCKIVMRVELDHIVAPFESQITRESLE